MFSSKSFQTEAAPGKSGSPKDQSKASSSTAYNITQGEDNKIASKFVEGNSNQIANEAAFMQSKREKPETLQFGIPMFYYRNQKNTPNQSGKQDPQ